MPVSGLRAARSPHCGHTAPRRSAGCCSGPVLTACGDVASCATRRDPRARSILLPSTESECQQSRGVALVIGSRGVRRLRADAQLLQVNAIRLPHGGRSLISNDSWIAIVHDRVGPASAAVRFARTSVASSIQSHIKNSRTSRSDARYAPSRNADGRCCSRHSAITSRHALYADRALADRHDYFSDTLAFRFHGEWHSAWRELPAWREADR